MSGFDTANERLATAQILESAGKLDAAERQYRETIQEFPHHAATYTKLARLLIDRHDRGEAISVLESARSAGVEDPAISLNLALLVRAAGDLKEAASILVSLLKRSPDSSLSWLILGSLYDELKLEGEAFVASYQAMSRAQRNGEWLDAQSTPSHFLGMVKRAEAIIRSTRKPYLTFVFDELRTSYGAVDLRRIESALAVYLKERSDSPYDPRQQPRFLFIPGLSDHPIHDPYTQPWARDLESLFPQIRGEYEEIVESPEGIQSFFKLNAGETIDRYLEGTGVPPAWDGFFFYRRGERYHDNHNRCPNTSAFLEGAELCRIDGDAPEILFSLMRPRTKILPHFGVTNARLVMHLPLIVPQGCSLQLTDENDIEWREGKLIMFDDTFEHAAQNQSESTRGILLMDCWNPQLTQIERIAVARLIERIHGYQLGKL